MPLIGKRLLYYFVLLASFGLSIVFGNHPAFLKAPTPQTRVESPILSFYKTTPAYHKQNTEHKFQRSLIRPANLLLLRKLTDSKAKTSFTFYETKFISFKVATRWLTFFITYLSFLATHTL